MKLTRHLRVLGPDPINAPMVVRDHGQNFVLIMLRAIDGTEYEAWFSTLDFATLCSTLSETEGE